MYRIAAFVFAIASASPALVALPAAQAPAQAPVSAPAPAPGIIPQVRAALNAGDIARAEALVAAFRKEHGTTPEALEAFSWLGRGALAQKKLDQAEQFALDAYDLSLGALEGRGLDDEPRLPIALGAAIEVRGQVMAARGNRSEAVLFLRKEADTYGKTSIIERINKNINLISLENEPAFELGATESLAGSPVTLASLQGKPVILYLWAHWCPDCRAMSPILRDLQAEYAGTGLTILAPTKRYGYVAKRQPASPADEFAYIKSIRAEHYAWMSDTMVPVSAEVFTRYGVSTTPTLVFINRDGRVRLYHPGQMTREEIEPVVKAMTAGTSH
jgi:cytochrome c biogenesis protein CcmG/thiol:disulfide interchange protein DsbE